MGLYSLIRPLLFSFDAETSHNLSLKGLKYLDKLGMLGLFSVKPGSKPVSVMGISFPSRVGLAAGLDKNGDYISALSKIGFGFIEIGTVTPKPQSGNPKPRLFRLPAKQAIINRMGFNNKGVDYLIDRVREANYRGVLGINIGKNANTPIERAVDDYLICMDKVYEYASYITINVSSPNTKNLRQLQEGDEIRALLAKLKQEQTKLAEDYQKYVPLLVKIAPDLNEQQVKIIAEVILETGIDGVIATNTTISRDGVENEKFANEQGGLSGQPVFEKSNFVLQELRQHLPESVPIIAVGGIMSADDAQKKFAAGASLVQIYSGFIYRGPELVRQIGELT